MPTTNNGGGGGTAVASTEIGHAQINAEVDPFTLANATAVIGTTQLNEQALATLANDTTLTAIAYRDNQFATVTLAAGAGFTGAANISAKDSATLAVASSLTAFADLGRFYATSTMASASGISGTAQMGANDSATMAAATTLTGTALKGTQFASATFGVNTGILANVNSAATASALLAVALGQSAIGTGAGGTAWSGAGTFAVNSAMSVNAQVGASMSAAFTVTMGQTSDASKSGSGQAWEGSAKLAAQVTLFCEAGVSVQQLGDLTLVENQSSEFFGQHDIYQQGIANIYLLLSHVSDENPTMTFYRPDYSYFTVPATIGQGHANTPKGEAMPGRYLICEVNVSMLNAVGVWRAHAKIDGVGATFYVRH